MRPAAAHPPRDTPRAPRAPPRRSPRAEPYLLAILDTEPAQRVVGDPDRAVVHRNDARPDRPEPRPLPGELDRRHRPRPLAVGIADRPHHDLARVAHHGDLIGRRAEVRPAVE